MLSPFFLPPRSFPAFSRVFSQSQFSASGGHTGQSMGYLSQRQYLHKNRNASSCFPERTPLQMRHLRLGDVKITQVVALIISITFRQESLVSEPTSGLMFRLQSSWLKLYVHDASLSAGTPAALAHGCHRRVNLRPAPWAGPGAVRAGRSRRVSGRLEVPALRAAPWGLGRTEKWRPRVLQPALAATLRSHRPRTALPAAAQVY